MDAPTAYKNAGLANLVGGLFTAVSSFGIGLSLIWICIGVVWIVPFGVALYQAFVGYQMYQGQAVGNAKMASLIGAVSSFLSGNIFASLAGGFAVMQLNEPDVAGWLEARA